MSSLLRAHLRNALLFSVLINILTLAPTLYLLQVYDRVLSSRSLETLGMLAAFTVIALITMMSLEVVRGKLLTHFGASLDHKLGRMVLMSHLDERARRLSIQNSQGLRDLTLLRNFLSGPAIIAFFDAPWMIIYLIIIFLFHWMLGVLAAVSAALLFGLAILNHRTTKASVKSYETQQRYVDGLAGQLTRNSEVIAVLGMAERMVNAWDKMKMEAMQEQTRVFDAANFYKALTKFLRQLIQVAAMGVGAWLVIDQYATGGVMLATTILLGKALMPVEQIIGSWKQSAEVRDAWPRLESLLQQKDNPPQVMLPAPTGKILVQQVVFTHGRGAKPILNGVEFQLNAGEVLAVIGPSASGKSTLVRLLTGIWKPQSGAIRLDGADITQWPREALGHHLGYVPQDVELFAGAVSENIARVHRFAVSDSMPSNASSHSQSSSALQTLDSEAIVRAAQRANVHEMILHLPQGYETEIGEFGQLLSGGQRQRIALARALYGNPKLVILDEPNANLDTLGEQQLHATIRQLKDEGVTVIFVTHRGALIDLADKVLILRDGVVERFGPRLEVQRWLEERHAQSVVPIRRPVS